MTFHIRECLDARGKNWYRSWLKRLALATQARIQARILRFEQGNLGDIKHIGNGVWEARLHMSPGYRLYFGKVGKEVILLLTGGDKGSQKKDIDKAKELWKVFEGG